MILCNWLHYVLSKSSYELDDASPWRGGPAPYVRSSMCVDSLLWFLCVYDFHTVFCYFFMLKACAKWMKSAPHNGYATLMTALIKGKLYVKALGNNSK